MAHIKDNLDIIDNEYHMNHVWHYDRSVYYGDTTAINKPAHKGQPVSQLMAAAVLGVNNTATPTTNTTKYNEIWTDIDAQEIYLNQKPTCYLILGKPGLGAYNLGEVISKKYHCIHLCPRNIINDEIMQASLTGQCLDFNLKHNNICAYDTVFKILQQKIKSEAVKYRGYVISGLPLVSASENPYCLIKSKHSEEALHSADEFLFDLIYNLKRKKPKAPVDPAHTQPSSVSSTNNMEEMDMEVEEEEEKEYQEEEQAEEEEGVAELPKFVLNTCSHVFVNIKAYFETSYATLTYQLQELFNFYLKPDIIIHITCPDADVLTKKKHKYINCKNGNSTIQPFPNKVPNDLRWPRQYDLREFENPYDLHIFNPKYNCRPPINFNKKSVTQICNYKQYVLPYIEKKIKDYNPKQVITLDGRTSIYRMMHEISERLLLMDVDPVIIPEPLYLQEPPEDLDEFWAMVKGFKIIRSGVVTFNRHASHWLNRCPVELKKRRSLKGKPKYAVMLFKHVYLMSSLNNFISFCMNPRSFLKLRYLEPTCRVVVMGTKSSGKSMIAQCLSWLFDTPIICYNTVLEKEREKKYQRYCKTILSEISATIEDTRLREWEKLEEKRLANLQAWNDNVLVDLKKYIPLLSKHLKHLAIIKKKREASAEKKRKDREALAEVRRNERKALAEEWQQKKDERKIKREKIENEEMTEQVAQQLEEMQEKQEEEIEEEQEKQQDEFIEEEEQDPKFITKFNFHRQKLYFLPVDNIDECNAMLANKNVTQYADPELTTITIKPAFPPALGDTDVTQRISDYIIANDLKNEIEPTTEEIMEKIKSIITTKDAAHHHDTKSTESYGTYIIDGFPSHTDYMDILSTAKLTPDYTIAVIENRELNSDLMKYYLNVEKIVKDPLAKLSLVKDPLILCKLRTKKIPSYKFSILSMTQDVLPKVHIIVEPEVNTKENESDSVIANLITSFNESIEKFREEWDNLKLHLEDKSKCYIEIELENKTDVEVLEELFLKLRRGYYLTNEPNEEDEPETDSDDNLKNLLTYNNPQTLCETGIYCPFTYFNYGILWEGKREFSIKYDNKTHYFAKEEFLEQFQKDVTKYQAYNNPFKKLPTLKICIIGCIGSGKTMLAKRIAKEMGLIHIDFEDYINYHYMPRHFKKVGRKYENPFTDTPVEDEEVVEFQLDEENPNLLADILFNETELRRIFYNYFERGQTVIPLIMHRIIQKLWYTYPYTHTGFVLDGYPRIAQDVEDLIQCNCIPDLVIELESTSESAVDRIGPIMHRQWQSHLKEAKEAHKRLMESEKKKWSAFIMKTVVVQLIIEEMIDNCIVDPTTAKQQSVESFIFDANPLGSANVDPNLFAKYNQTIQEYPEPKDTLEWEKSDEARENIYSRIEAVYESDLDNIESLKEILTDNQINIFTINSAKPFYKVMRTVFCKLNYFKCRNQSFLEQTNIIIPDIAELLLTQGFCFLSKFGRLCPVYIHENRQTLQNSYKISRCNGKIFPVIHRAYVYFICSEDNVNKFRINPLKYITSEALNTYYPFPLSIGIIGAPKSGKSALAAKLAKSHNLICMSRGMALRNVLENMHWTELGSKILRKLNDGETIDTDYIISAIQTVAIDHRTITYGFVLDGFPTSPYEAKLLVKYGLYPNMIFDISTESSIILENSQKDIHLNILKYIPPYSKSFIENRFNKWNEQCYGIRKWINSDFQNMFMLKGNKSKWQCLQDAYSHIKQRSSKIHYYLANVEKCIVPAHAMNICNEVFLKKQSRYKNLCPACLAKNVLRHNGYPNVDKTGIVYYDNKYYWICAEHMDLVLENPYYYLSRFVSIPELPAAVHVVNHSNVYANGICIVTYAENLPGQILERGTNKFAATYKQHTYLFCSEKCQRKFLDKPHIYSDITVFKGSNWFPRLSLKKLPDLGYLEQTLGNILTEACCAINAVRPKYPGLNCQISAAIYIALYLKAHNTRFSKKDCTTFKKALKSFENRSRLILDLGLRMRSMENPFSTYPKCHHGVPKYYSPTSSIKQLMPSDPLSTSNEIALVRSGTDSTK